MASAHRGVFWAAGWSGAWSIMIAILPTAARADVTAEEVRQAIELGASFLLREQHPDGSWREHPGYPGGISALATLALINAGVSSDDPAIERALAHLRKIPLEKTYVVALQTMVFVAASPEDDRHRIAGNVQWLAEAQVDRGQQAGMWSYTARQAMGGDNSNTQFALLALRDASEIGVEVDPAVWRRAEQHWRRSQRGDGAWEYGREGMGGARGSMTAAGIASLIITGARLHQSQERIDPTGQIHQCGHLEPDRALERGIQWLSRHFSVRRNPNTGSWHLYYLYGLERAGRLSAQRFFGQHDWYREGAEHLVAMQNPLTGSWTGRWPGEQNAIVATSFALLFLSKGKSPVIINKLQYGPGSDWNNDPHDVRHLTEFLSQHWKRPLHQPLTWQVVNLSQATVDDLLQAPIGYFNGHGAPRMSDDEVALLRAYVAEGGYLFAEACCSRSEFDAGFRQLIQRMYPETDYELKPLPPEHPIWRAEFLLDPAAARPLWGVEVGCRTAIIYSPEDLSCYWEQASQKTGDQPEHLRPMVDKALSIGANVVAYATGQEFADKLARRPTTQSDVATPEGTRGVLQIAKLRHTGGYDVAPRALRNLLLGLHDQVPGMRVNPEVPHLTAVDPAISFYPILYMHGRSHFTFSEAEVDRLREHLELGSILFADACCGSEQFDRSFRELCQKLFPERPLERIPPDHPLFRSADAGGTWYDLREVRRREPVRAGPGQPMRVTEQVGEPYLEGIAIEDRYAVIYSRYDISCALERSGSVECRGYVHEDALKIAINVVIYATHY